MKVSSSSLLSLMALAASTAHAALNPIVVKGNAFYDSKTNSRFYIRGVDYLPGGASNFTDPLADADICKRDIEYFKDLGVNTIRVYSVDNSQDHSDCMKQLDDAGIYLVLDVNTPKNSISRADPKVSYNTAYLQHVFATIDVFAKYDNVLGFFAANEVINDENTTDSAPYVKAVVRDMKLYMAAQNLRTIPVGYSAADISTNRYQQIQYFNCGNDDTARIDMFGMNDYSWCGDSSFTESGYDQKVEMYSNYTRPLFLSEFGCNKVEPRPFSEVKAIYSTDMTSVFSGGLVYEYTEEENNYGLVVISSSGTVTKKDDYNNLKKAFAGVSDPSGDGGAKSDDSAAICPEFEAGIWEVDANAGLPKMPIRASALLKSGAGTPSGIADPPTQYGDSGDKSDESNWSYSPTTSASSSSSSSTGRASSGSSGSSSSSASASATSSSAAVPGLAAPSVSQSLALPMVAMVLSLAGGFAAVAAF